MYNEYESVTFNNFLDCVIDNEDSEYSIFQPLLDNYLRYSGSLYQFCDNLNEETLDFLQKNLIHVKMLKNIYVKTVREIF